MDRYWQAISVIEAQDILIGLSVSDWPNMSKTGRKSFHKKIHKLAYPVTHREEKPLSTEQLAARIRGALNG